MDSVTEKNDRLTQVLERTEHNQQQMRKELKEIRERKRIERETHARARGTMATKTGSHNQSRLLSP